MHGTHMLEQESSSGGNGQKQDFRRDSEGGVEMSDYSGEFKQHGAPTARLDINSSSSWGDSEKSLLRMIERNKTSKVFDWVKHLKSKGIILAMFAVILELVMWIQLKRIKTDKIPFDIFYLRAFTNMAASFLWGKALGVNIIGIESSQRNNIRVLTVVSMFASGLTFISYMINALTLATILIYTSILFTSILAFFRFSEKVNRYDAVNIVISVVSVLLIMNFFDREKSRITEVIIGVFGAMWLGITYVIVKDLDDSIDFISLTFYEWLGVCTFGPIAYFALGAFIPSFEPSIDSLLNTDIQTTTLICVWGFLSQTLLNAALRFDKTTKITGMRYIQIVISLIVDVWVFNTHFSVYEVMGCVIILTYNLSLIVITWDQTRS